MGAGAGVNAQPWLIPISKSVKMEEQLLEQAGATSVVVAVCTYRRLNSLLRTLEHVGRAFREADLPARIVVVDNDGQDAAVEPALRTLADRLRFELHYRIETTPGISAARNAAFAEADRLGVRFVAMLDDDEWPDPEWLAELLRVQSESEAAVVGGPVSPVFPQDRQELGRYASFWAVQHQNLRGRTLVFCTCNFLIDMERLRGRPRPLFDDAFGLSGGGDTVFFRALHADGFQMAWAPLAVVQEEVPHSRASLKWLCQRRYRSGNHAVRWEAVDGSRARVLLKTMGLVARLPVYPLLRREPEAPFVGWLLESQKVCGRIAGHFGSVFVEYGRPGSAGSAGKACH